MRLLEKLKFPILSTFLRDETNEDRTFFALTLITGVAAGLVAVSLHQITYALTDWIGTNKSFDLRAFILGGGALLLSSWFTFRHFPSTSGSGIPGVKVALAVFHGKIELKNTIAKYVTTIFSLSSKYSFSSLKFIVVPPQDDIRIVIPIISKFLSFNMFFIILFLF